MRGAARFLMAAVCAVALGLWAAAGASTSAPQAAANGKYQAWDGNRTTPAHLIPLKDEDDEPIIPTELRPMPFSSRFTCGPCHEYAKVQGGWHFSAVTSKADGRPGEPWIWFEPKTGTVLPLSYRKWAGAWDPKAVGIDSWRFTQLFGRHIPGGGPAEPPDDIAAAGKDARWNVSGKAEINCLACHNKSSRQDQSEWAKQMMRENLRWAATAAGGVGEVGGMASRLNDSWNVVDGPNPDDHEWAVAPSVKYRTIDFDGKHRYFFDLAYPPEDGRCLACHSVSAMKDVRAYSQTDVHTAAGLKCADCHRNDLGHGIVRGYEGEAEDTGNRTADSFTCRGCHLGESPDGKRLVVPGRMGAPYPKHTGIPLVHFRSLACTTCHSGPVPEKELTRVRTSRANRLGIYGVAQWHSDQPAVVEPVYMKDAGGKIGPQRLVWPAFWARREGKTLTPVKPEIVEAAAGGVLKSEENIARVLAALTQALAENETPLLASGKFLFAVNVDAGLDATLTDKLLGPAKDAQAQRTARIKGEENPKAAPPSKGAVQEAIQPGQKPAKAWVPGKTGAEWLVKNNGEIALLIPDFDPASAEKDPNIEPKIQAVLQALATVAGAPGKPAVLVRKTLYRLTDGNLDIAEAPAGLEGAAGPGWLKEGKLLPLAGDFDVRTVTAKAGTEQTLTEEQVGFILKALAAAPESVLAGAIPAAGGADLTGAVTIPTVAQAIAANAAAGGGEKTTGGGTFVYVSGGYMFSLAGDGKLKAAKSDAAAPVTWPLAHNVRPAQQSLGRKSCGDCHSINAAFFFASAKGTGPLLTKTVAMKSATSFMGVGGFFHRVFGLTFVVRPLSKIVMGLVILVTGALLVVFFVVVVGKLAGLIEKR